MQQTQTNEAALEPLNENFEATQNQTAENQVNGNLPKTAQNQTAEQGQASELNDAPELILGKFKSVDELQKAYTELQRHQGESSKELGELRKDANSLSELTQSLQQALELKEQMSAYLNEYRTKYDKPEYFQDSKFREIYKEAFRALGQNLDTDKFITLLEDYVGSRISAHERSKSAKEETEKLISQMTYDKNPKTEFTPPKKAFDEMSQQEINDMLDRLL